MQLIPFSFNSSGATIMPDRNDNGLRYPGRTRLSGGYQNERAGGPHYHSLDNAAPFASEAELDELVSGGSGDDGSVASQHWPTVRTSWKVSV